MNTIEIKVATSDNNFVGVECLNNNMIFTFPIGYHILPKKINIKNTKEIKKYQEDIMILLKQLENNQENYYEDGTFPFNFSAAIYLINDYFKNRLIYQYKYNNTNLNNKNINWRKTIHDKIPFYSSGNFIYLDKCYKKVETEKNDITKIQIYCLNKAFQILSIFYNNYHIPEIKHYTKKEMLYKLNIALSKTNIDEDKTRLDKMIKFINGTSLSTINNKEIKIGTTSFNKKWEEKIRNNIKQKYKILDICPQAYYIHNEEKIYVSKLIPDVIFEDDNYLYIVDAKYYKINTFPQSSDIAKQITYAQYIGKIKKGKKIKNIFLLPNNIPDEKKLYYGYATIDIENNSNYKNKIDVYYIDTKTTLK